jgi:hypothetical protein
MRCTSSLNARSSLNAVARPDLDVSVVHQRAHFLRVLQDYGCHKPSGGGSGLDRGGLVPTSVGDLIFDQEFDISGRQRGSWNAMTEQDGPLLATSGKRPREFSSGSQARRSRPGR